MKLNRRQLRRMILKEAMILKEMQYNPKRFYYKQPSGQSDYEVVKGTCPDTGKPFKIEVDTRQQAGKAAIYMDDYTWIKDKIPAACRIYPAIYTIEKQMLNPDNL